jgi:hypothetical protein
LATLAVLFAISIRSSVESRDRTYAAVLAQQGIEQLLAEHARGGPASLAGLEDLDNAGSTSPPDAGVFVRQWSVEPLAEAPGAVVITVEVARKAWGPDGPDRARMTTVRRRAP